MANEDLKEKEAMLLTERAQLDSRLKVLSDEVSALRGKVDLAGEDVDRTYYDVNKEKYKDIDLRDLVIVGKVNHRVVNKYYEFVISNLTKGESLAIDQSMKDYKNETGMYMTQMSIVQILSRALVRYGVPDKTHAVPKDITKAIEAIGQINEIVFGDIWREYNLFNRWINCALRFELKNS